MALGGASCGTTDYRMTEVYPTYEELRKECPRPRGFYLAKVTRDSVGSEETLVSVEFLEKLGWKSPKHPEYKAKEAKEAK